MKTTIEMGMSDVKYIMRQAVYALQGSNMSATVAVNQHGGAMAITGIVNILNKMIELIPEEEK